MDRSFDNAKWFDSVYNEYYFPLHDRARRGTGSDDVAADLAQETLMAASKQEWIAASVAKWAEIQPRLRSWLFLSLRHRILSYCRARKRGESRLKALSICLTGRLGGPPALVSMVEDESRSRVRSAIDQLPGELKKLIKMRFDEGKKISEIMMETGLTRAMVETRFGYAYALLRGKLAED